MIERYIVTNTCLKSRQFLWNTEAFWLAPGESTRIKFYPWLFAVWNDNNWVCYDIDELKPWVVQIP